MVKRRNLRGERTELYSPIGLLPIDAFTGRAPLGRLSAFLDTRDDNNGNWSETGIREVRTPGGVIAYPGLGRSAEVAGPPKHYRVRIEAEFYQPLYRKTDDGIEFDAPPYNDTNPPANYPKDSSEFPQYLESVLKKVMLAPAPNYPFPDHILVLRGVVVDSVSNEPGVNVEVFWGNKERTVTTGPTDGFDKRRVLTQAGGVFGLPLRISENGHTATPQKIDAFDYRTKRAGSIEISIPQDLGKNNTIPIKP